MSSHIAYLHSAVYLSFCCAGEIDVGKLTV